MAPANRVSNQEEGGERARERQEIQEEKEGALGLHWLPRQQATVEYIKTVRLSLQKDLSFSQEALASEDAIFYYEQLS